MPDFCNTYYFVRTPDREGIPKDHFAGDYDPSDSSKEEDHSRYWPERYTGSIPVKLKVRTPLFITDPKSAHPHPARSDHMVYDCLETIPATAIKGILRSAYETITNSRYGVFSEKQHKKLLVFRDAGLKQTDKTPPWECLPDSLRPPSGMEFLSPAERLFGWVSQNNKSTKAWKGKVRITNPFFLKPRESDKESPVLVFGKNISLPLAILGSPKPTQARFYLGDSEGKPQKDGILKEETRYSTEKKLRGRKVYLHHKVVAGNVNYWAYPYNDRTKQRVDGMYQEYRQLSGDDERSNQNRSITGWIPRDTVFTFDLIVENLTREELGALLTLLTLSAQGYCFRLGFAKPLGLGSVTLSLNLRNAHELQVFSSEQIRERYASLNSECADGMPENERRRLIRDYKLSVAHAYGEVGDITEAPADSWRNLELIEMLDEEQRGELGRIWSDATARNLDAFPQEEFPLFEVLYQDQQVELQEAYVQERQIIELGREKIANKLWSALPFVEDLLKSMQGPDGPVHTPRTGRGRSDNGYEWFVQNESRQGPKVSLPEMCQPLDY